MAHLNVTYAPDVLNSPPLRAAAEEATVALTALNQTADETISAGWAVDPSGQLALTLGDDTDTARSRFRSSELKGLSAWARMHRAYNQLIDVRIRRHLANVSGEETEPEPAGV